MIGILTKERAVARIGFSRWFAVPAALAVHLCIGQAYALSVFYGPLSRLIGGNVSTVGDWTPAELDHIFTLAIVTLGVSAALAARWQYRAGPRAVMFAAACCFGGGFLIAALGVKLHQLSLLYLGYGVVGGIGLGLGYVSPVSALIQWFPDRRGLATGLAIMGFGGGAMIGAPLSTFLIETFRSASSPGVAEAFAAMGVIYFVAMVIGAFAIRTPAPGDAMVMQTDEASVTIEAAVRTPQFYLLWILLAVNVVTGIGVLGQAPEMLHENLGALATPPAILGFVGLLSLFNMAGRILCASASDFLGRRNTYTILLLAGATLYASAPYMGAQVNVALFVLDYAIMMGIFGGCFATFPAYIADCYGPKFVGGIHGRLLTAWSAGALGSVALIWFREHEITVGVSRSQAYATTLEIMAGLFLIGLVCNWLIKPADRATVIAPAPCEDHSAIPARATHSRVLHSTPQHIRIAFMALWVLVGVPLAWGIVLTIGLASELDLTWKLALTLLPLLLGVVVSVGFLYLDKSRFAVTGVSPSYIMAVALPFGLYASLMATEVWQKSETTAALNRTEISALGSVVAIAEGIHPEDRTVRRAAEAELRAIGDRTNWSAATGSGAPVQTLYTIAGNSAFFGGNAAADAAFYRLAGNIHDAHLERAALQKSRLAPEKLFSILLFGCLTQLTIALSHAGKGRSLAVAVMLFSIAFSASIGILELMDESLGVAPSAEMTLTEPIPDRG